MKALAVVMVVIGAIMIYAGVYGRSLRSALTGKVQSA